MNTYTELEVKELLEKQRGLCAEYLEDNFTENPYVLDQMKNYAPYPTLSASTPQTEEVEALGAKFPHEEGCAEFNKRQDAKRKKADSIFYKADFNAVLIRCGITNDMTWTEIKTQLLLIIIGQEEGLEDFRTKCQDLQAELEAAHKAVPENTSECYVWDEYPDETEEAVPEKDLKDDLVASQSTAIPEPVTPVSVTDVIKHLDYLKYKIYNGDSSIGVYNAMEYIKRTIIEKFTPKTK